MGLKRTDEFRADAVRIALTSGLTRRPVSYTHLRAHETYITIAGGGVCV